MRPPPPCWVRGRTPSCSTSSPASGLPQARRSPRATSSGCGRPAPPPWPPSPGRRSAT
eukprot:SM013313S27063  [mRNA]  locus=s13313:40:347:- [translate_table: standard]